MYDLVFRGATVIDGSGNPSEIADVAVLQGRIAAVGDLGLVSADEEVDARGKVLSPGFIDVHTHDDRACLDKPDMVPKISQGVTTVIVGNCGLSLAPLIGQSTIPEPLNLLGNPEQFEFASFADYVDAVNRTAPAINIAALVGHNTLRVAVMDSLDREANSEEIQVMQGLLVDALDAGAVGMSSGVFYVPGQAATLHELVSLAKVVAQKGGVYTSHIRDEYDDIMGALEEAVTTAKQAETPLVISHHKCAGVQNWGRTEQTLPYIDKVREHQCVHMDCYPYHAGSSVLDPELVDGKIEIMVTWSQPHPEMGSRMLADIAHEWDCTEKEAAEKLLPGGGCYFQMHEDDVRRVLAHPASMIGSDGLPNDPHPHPRLWGAFPRVLGHYSRDLKLLPLEQAVHKMTGLSAREFGLRRRGQIQIGYHADLVLFDPDRVIDKASFDNPCVPAEGIDMVCVNGTIAWRDGASTQSRTGCFIRRSKCNEDAL